MSITGYLLSTGLKKKVLLGYVFMSTLIALILAVVGISAHSIKVRYADLNEISSNIQLITQLKSSIEGTRAAFLLMALTKNPEVRKAQEELIVSHLEKIDECISKIKRGRYREKAEEIEKVFLPFRETLMKEIIPLIHEDKISEVMGIVGRVQAPRANVFFRTGNEMIES